MLPVCIVVDGHVAVNNKKLLSFGTGIQEWLLFALLSKFRNISNCCHKYKSV
jgi:hypothetical protein